MSSFPQNSSNSSWNPFTLAIDDSDSPNGGCTTHLTGLLLYYLKDRILLSDYPLLVRLAPGIPWKTRGNAATVVRGWIKDLSMEELLDLVKPYVKEYSSGRGKEPGKGPGIAIYPDNKPWTNPTLRDLYYKGVSDIVDGETLLKYVEKEGVLVWGSRGCIGAILSLASLPPEDPYTYELIAYRRPENWDKSRCIQHDPYYESCIPPCASNNIDLSSGLVAAAPHGPDPVLAGFRGTCIEALGCYRSLLCEDPHFWVLYRSNQHSDIHYSLLTPRLTPYQSTKLIITIINRPMEIPGPHIILYGKTTSGKIISVAVYRETGPLLQLAKQLTTGDIIEVAGTVRPYPGGKEGYTLAAEKIRILKINQLSRKVSPRCPKCGKRMKKLGRNKGYKCPKCGFRDPQALPLELTIFRKVAPGTITPTPSNLRHLTRPSWLKDLHRTPIPNAPLRVNDVFSFEEPPTGTVLLCDKCLG